MEVKFIINLSIGILLFAACESGNNASCDLESIKIDVDKVCLSRDEVYASKIMIDQIGEILNIQPYYDDESSIDESSILDTTFFEMVKLETNENCILSDNINQVSIHGDTIIIADYNTKSIYFFNKEGEYLTKISHMGRGPQDYIDISDVFFDDKYLFITDNYGSKILCFDFVAQFKYKVGIEGSYGENAICYHDTVFALTSTRRSHNNIISVFDRNGNQIGQHIPYFPNRDHKMMSGGVKHAFISQPDGFDVFVPDYTAADNYQHSNVVYHYANGKFSPKYWIDFGKHNVPLKIARKGFDYFYNTKCNEKYVSGVNSIHDSGRFLLFHINFCHVTYGVIYDKKTSNTMSNGWYSCYFKKFNISTGVNDDFLVYNDNLFVYVPANIAKYEEIIGCDTLKWQNLKQTLKDDDNGILVMLKLKSYDTD